MNRLGIGINSKVEVLFDKVIYKSTIQDMDYKNKVMLIALPVTDGIYLTLNEDDIIDQIFYDESGDVFKYKTKIIKRVIDNNIPFYKVTFPYDIEKIQRRDYVRVNTTEVLEYNLDGNVKEDEIDEKSCEKGILIDLSGGGMRFKGNKELSRGSIISADVRYGSENIEIKGKIVRVEKTEDKKYIYGISFMDISNSARERIIRLVFTIMRKQRECV
ncbi:PilZ domain-containing protein [Clostridium sp.]|uniref:flagellar brake protein n=1 Tax=Clostridium sp. TaxID=1506 RepID=UPI0026097547|nr:PilZ domain-containing protein [Clostridium sp.]